MKNDFVRALAITGLRTFIFAAGLVAADLLTSPASLATTINANAAVDLTTVGSLNIILSPLDSTVTINPGDSVDLHVGFANSQALHIQAAGSATFTFWMLRSAGSSSFTINNIAITLLGLNTTGTWLNPTTIATASNGTAHIGPESQDLGLGAGQFIEFTGFDVTYDVASIDADSPFGNVLLLTFGDATNSIVGGSATPLPAALPLFATGLGGLGLLGWRRRRKAQAAA